MPRTYQSKTPLWRRVVSPPMRLLGIAQIVIIYTSTVVFLVRFRCYLGDRSNCIVSQLVLLIVMYLVQRTRTFRVVTWFTQCSCTLILYN